MCESQRSSAPLKTSLFQRDLLPSVDKCNWSKNSSSCCKCEASGRKYWRFSAGQAASVGREAPGGD